jgi:hypothetical protein
MPEHETGDASGRAGLGGLFSTWPRKMLAVVLTATLGWVVSQTLPAAWRETSERAGLAPSAIHVDVITDPDVIQTLDGLQNPEFIVDRPIEQIGAPPNGESERGRFAWAKAMGAINALDTAVRIVIRGQSSSPVILNGLDVEKVADRAPPRGVFLTYVGQGAGQAVRFFEVNLKPDHPTVKYVPPKHGDATPFPYRVTQTDVEVFDVYAYTLGPSDVLWQLQLSYSAAGKDGVIAIKDHGRPFETVGDAGIKKATTPYAWFHGKWRNLNEPCC